MTVCFCCERSGGIAADAYGVPDDVTLVKLPCAAKVDVLHLLRAWEEGAHRVLVLACFQDCCRSLDGNLWARKRVEYVNKLLAEMGLEQRTEIHHLAANTPAKFDEVLMSNNE